MRVSAAQLPHSQGSMRLARSFPHNRVSMHGPAHGHALSKILTEAHACTRPPGCKPACTHRGIQPCSCSQTAGALQAGRLHVLPAVKTGHNISATFALPPLLEHYCTKPEDYISHLVGHEGQGSLLSALKRRCWHSLSEGSIAACLFACSGSRSTAAADEALIILMCLSRLCVQVPWPLSIQRANESMWLPQNEQEASAG